MVDPVAHLQVGSPVSSIIPVCRRIGETLETSNAIIALSAASKGIKTVRTGVTHLMKGVGCQHHLTVIGITSRTKTCMRVRLLL